MAEEKPRLTIPAAGVNALDADTYDGGYPSSSALGRQIARNDRALHGMLRRTLVAQAWDVQNPPKLCRYWGTRIGPYPCPTTPWVKNGEWRVRIKPDAGAIHDFIPWVDPFRRFAGPFADQPAAWTHTDGGGATEATVGPLELPLEMRFDTPPMSGVVVRAHIKTGTATTNSLVGPPGRASIVSAAGNFNALGTPPCSVIRLINSVSGEEYMGWRDIIDVGTTTAGDILASDGSHGECCLPQSHL